MFQKNVSRPQCRSLKTPAGEVSHLTTCFLRARSIIFFVMYSHCMHVHKTKVRRPRPRRYIFKTETRSRPSILPNSWDRHETKTFNLQDRDETKRSKKNVSRPPRDRDIQDRHYISGSYTVPCNRSKNVYINLKCVHIVLGKNYKNYTLPCT